MKQKRNNLEYILVAVLTAGIFLSACAVRNIYPFGSELISNTSDYGQQMLPIITHIWDALHGRDSFWFTWKVGLGTSFAGTASHFSLISPFYLFFLFVSRDQIPYSMIWFILIRLMVSALSMCFFLRNDRLFFSQKPASWLIVTASILYALNGYTLMYYGMMWQDCAAAAPFFFCFLDQMLQKEGEKDGKTEVGYTISLAILLIMNIQISFSMVLFVIAWAGGWMFLICRNHHQRGKVSCKLILYSLLALGISMAVFLPGLINMQNSYRMATSDYGFSWTSYLNKVLTAKQEPEKKYLMLASMTVPLILILKDGLPKIFHRTMNSLDRFEVYLLVLMVLPVIFESVNAIYHNGPYSMYPMRYGFLMIFVILLTAVSQEEGKQCNPRKYAVFFSILMLGSETVLFARKLESEPLNDAYLLAEELKSDEDTGLSRTKITDNSVIDTYALLGNQSSLGSYVPENSRRQVELAQKLGYSQDWVKLCDAGGTLFSDAVLQMNRYVISGDRTMSWQNGSSAVLDQELSGDFNTYLLKYTYSPAFFISSDTSLPSEYADNPFTAQNQLSELLFGTDLIRYEEISLSSDEDVSIELSVSGNQAVYLWSDTLTDCTFELNGTPVLIPERSNAENTSYPSSQNNGIISLGCYSDETRTLHITNSEEAGTLIIGYLDLDALKETSENQTQVLDGLETEKNMLNMTVTVQEDGYILLPVAADNGWNAMVNGTSASLGTLWDGLILVPVTAGENQISMTFIPEKQKAGQMISVVSIALLLLVIWRSKNHRCSALIGKIAEILVWIAAAIVLFFVYAFPICYTVILHLIR